MPLSNILIFAGTIEGRQLSKLLASSGIGHTICVATSYGNSLVEKSEYVTVHEGRMDAEEISVFIKKHDFSLIVDATHPFAYEVTENIKKALEGPDIGYIRIKREGLEKNISSGISYFDTNEECLHALKETRGNILLTVGSKELHIYASEPSVKERLYVRVIPGEESLRICTDLGINGKNIIAMQGPFSKELNDAFIDHFSIEHMVTKQSGKSGGFYEKIESAACRGIRSYVIGCKASEDGCSFEKAVYEIEKITGVQVFRPPLTINLIGAGMGDGEGLTSQAGRLIDDSDVIMGDKRLVSGYKDGSKEVYEYFSSKDIIPILHEISKRNVFLKKKISVLFSGDPTFYSGGTLLYESLDNEIKNGRLNAEVKLIPGISSLGFLSSRLGISCSDAYICSMHGRELTNISRIVMHHKKVFILLSGKKDVNTLGEKLLSAGLEDVRIILGSNLSYDDEKICVLSPETSIKFEDDGILSCIVLNDNAKSRPVSYGMKADAFLRGNVPMTKEEIREVALSKLHLKCDSVFWDIGSGTGSVSVEAALLSDSINVYSIECNDTAADLTQANADRYSLENIKVVKGFAPDVFNDLPMPTHAFIGGSKGRLFEILNSLYHINDKMRIVINAVTPDTISKIESIQDNFSVSDFEIVKMQVFRLSGKGGEAEYDSENPVHICSFSFV